MRGKVLIVTAAASVAAIAAVAGAADGVTVAGTARGATAGTAHGATAGAAHRATANRATANGGAGPVSVQRSVTGAAGAHAARPARATRPGAGWTVATWSRTENAPGTLYLVDPAGHRRAIAAVAPNAQPLLWSPDGARVLVTSEDGVVQITLRTGHVARVALPEGSRPVSYSRPRGLAVLAAVDTEVKDRAGSHLVSRLERFGFDGRHQQTYPRTVTGAGVLAIDSVIEDRSGGHLVVGADRGVVLLRNNGTVARRLLTNRRDCTVTSWWRRDVALASCKGTLWAVPTSGSTPQRISDGPAGANIFGYSTAWRYGKGTLGLAPNGCGPQSLVRFADGAGRRLSVPQPIAKKGRPVYVGHSGNRVLMTVNPGYGCMSGPATLFAYDAVSHRSTALLGPTVNGGTVRGAIAYPAD